jgi:hypothetical protein
MNAAKVVKRAKKALSDGYTRVSKESLHPRGVGGKGDSRYERDSKPSTVNSLVVSGSFGLVERDGGSSGDDELEEGEEHEDSDDTGGEEGVTGEDEGRD